MANHWRVVAVAAGAHAGADAVSVDPSRVVPEIVGAGVEENGVSTSVG